MRRSAKSAINILEQKGKKCEEKQNVLLIEGHPSPPQLRKCLIIKEASQAIGNFNLRW